VNRAFLTLFLTGLTATASAQTPLTFQEALQRALTMNNSIERARADIRVADANREQLLSNVLPRITATGNAVRNSTDVSFGTGSDARTILAQNDWSYRIVLSQPLYAGRREFRAYSQAKLGVNSAQLAERGTEDAVLLRVASNYLALVNADALIDVEKRNVELSQKRRTQASAFEQAGEVTKVDVLRAETSIKAAQRLMAWPSRIARPRPAGCAPISTSTGRSWPPVRPIRSRPWKRKRR
jgi:Outer membrane protein